MKLIITVINLNIPMKKILNSIYKINSKSNLLNYDNKNFNLLESTRLSFVCKYFDRLYLISSAHDISNKSTENIDNKSLKQFEKILIPEIDLVIYEISYLENIKFIDIKDNKYSINDVNKRKELYFIDNKMKIQNVNILFMQKSKYNNACYPDMLKYFGKSNFSDLSGCSGSPIFDNDLNIYGILSGYGDEYLNITPFFFVKRILDEILHFNSFNGLCNFWHDTDIIKRNLIISNKENINYNLYVKKENFAKLIKEDLILKFDNKNIVNGMIFCDLLNMNIDIDSYITITKTIHNINSFYIYRSKNLFNKYLKIYTGNRDIYSAYNINMKDDLLLTKEVDNKVFIKINPMLFNYISEYRPVHIDEKLMNIFKLKYSEIFDNNYLLVEDKLLKKNIFKNVQDSYISIKM